MREPVPLPLHGRRRGELYNIIDDPLGRYQGTKWWYDTAVHNVPSRAANLQEFSSTPAEVSALNPSSIDVARSADLIVRLEDKRRERAPIDHFFRTLANTFDGDSVGVILTGTGSDGTLGIKEIKAHGGLTVVQDPREAEFDGMPQSAEERVENLNIIIGHVQSKDIPLDDVYVDGIIFPISVGIFNKPRRRTRSSTEFTLLLALLKL